MPLIKIIILNSFYDLTYFLLNKNVTGITRAQDNPIKNIVVNDLSKCKAPNFKPAKYDRGPKINPKIDIVMYLSFSQYIE